MTRADLLQTAMRYHSLGYQVLPLCCPNLQSDGCGSYHIVPAPKALFLRNTSLQPLCSVNGGNQRVLGAEVFVVKGCDWGTDISCRNYGGGEA